MNIVQGISDNTISIHSLLAEGDLPCRNRHAKQRYFNPLPPRGGRPAGRGAHRGPLDFNPLPPRGGRRGHQNGLPHRPSYFNPLPPRGGRRPPARASAMQANFNPLPPRGGRPKAAKKPEYTATISIHSLLAEGDVVNTDASSGGTISIHSLLAEGDVSQPADQGFTSEFQSTPSSRRETVAGALIFRPEGISIHSLLAEGDPARRSTASAP